MPAAARIMSSATAKAMSCAPAAASRTSREIGEIVVATRGGVPVRVKDVAEVSIGRELRTGSASVERARGRARHGADADRRQQPHGGGGGRRQDRGDQRGAAAGHRRTRPCSTARNWSTPPSRTVAKNLAEGALLVVVVLFLLLGNFRAALITALVIPVAMLMTATGMLQGKISANLMSLGALDFGLIVDGAVIIIENCLRHLAERQHELGREL